MAISSGSSIVDETPRSVAVVDHRDGWLTETGWHAAPDPAAETTDAECVAREAGALYAVVTVGQSPPE